MYIRSLRLKNFRNYEKQEIAFDNGTSILWGGNAQGKTNALEAIFLLSSGRSHRTAREKEMIAADSKYAHISAEIEHSDGLHTVDMVLSRSERKRIIVNGIPVSKTGEMMGHLCTVMFSPEDLSLIKDSPSERRRFMDLELSQAGKVYYYDLQKYLKVLEERNSLLKSISDDSTLMNTLPVWDEQFCAAAVPIIAARRVFCDKLKELSKELHSRLSGKNELLETEYVTCVATEDIYKELSDGLKAARKKDIALRTTTLGPHRDDIDMKINGMQLRSYGSQGQQRTAALALKMAEIELLRQSRGETPVLLLDDVFSELDTDRQKFLVDNLKGVQTVITCTGVDHTRLSGARLFNVKQGKISADK